MSVICTLSRPSFLQGLDTPARATGLCHFNRTDPSWSQLASTRLSFLLYWTRPGADVHNIYERYGHPSREQPSLLTLYFNGTCMQGPAGLEGRALLWLRLEKKEGYNVGMPPACSSLFIQEVFKDNPRFPLKHLDTTHFCVKTTLPDASSIATCPTSVLTSSLLQRTQT